MAKGNEEYLSVHSFKVTIDGTNWSVYESVDGIGIDFEDIPFNSEKKQMLNRAGRYNARDLHMTRRFKKDKEIYDWVQQVKKSGTEKNRKSGSIILMDDEDKEVLRFNFFEAWPKSWSGPQLTKDASGSDILREEVVLSIADLEMSA